MLALRDWQNFYILTGTAATTLIGLLFVAISIGSALPEKQARAYLHTFVSPTLLYYFQVLLVSCLAVMPLQTPLIYSTVLAVLGGFNILLALKVVWRLRAIHQNDEIDSGHWIWHILLPLTTGLLFVGSGISFFLAGPLALPGFAIADLLCLTIGLHNSWTLMIWMLLHREQTPAIRSSTDLDLEEKIS